MNYTFNNWLHAFTYFYLNRQYTGGPCSSSSTEYFRGKPLLTFLPDENQCGLLCVVWQVINYLSSLNKHPQVQAFPSILRVRYLLTRARVFVARGYAKCHIQDSKSRCAKLSWGLSCAHKMTPKPTSNYPHGAEALQSKMEIQIGCILSLHCTNLWSSEMNLWRGDSGCRYPKGEGEIRGEEYAMRWAAPQCPLHEVWCKPQPHNCCASVKYQNTRKYQH